MLRVEYYWDTPRLQGPLLATYYFLGDGTRGTAELEPFPESQMRELPSYERDSLREFYELLESWPGLLMFGDSDAMTLDRAWTRELVEEQAKRELETARPVIVALDAPKGQSNPVPKRELRKVTVTVVSCDDESPEH